MSDKANLKQLILVPAVITLAVTLLRLAGELLGGPALLFSSAAGGGGALVGISWLVPVFGAWLGWKLARAGERPRFWRALALAVLAVALLPATGLATARAGIPRASLTSLWIYVAVSVVGVGLALLAWPALGRALLAYGLAARVPVALVMLVAMIGNWGTHYDVPPSADFPAMSTLAKWVTIGLAPQLTLWIWYTVALGAIFGLVAGAIGGRRVATATA
jgi:hypothetical protein